MDILNLLSLPFKLIWSIISFPFNLLFNIVGFVIHWTWTLVIFPVNLVWKIGKTLLGTAMSVILFFTNPFGVSSQNYAVDPSSTLSVSVPFSQVKSSSTITNYQLTDAVSEAQTAFTQCHPKSPQPANASGIDKIIELKGYHRTDKFDFVSNDGYLDPDCSNPYTANLNKDDIDLITLNLREGIPYVFHGSINSTYARYCYNMELTVFNEKGEPIAKSEGFTKDSTLQVTPNKTGTYQLAVAVPNHDDISYCRYEVAEYKG